MNTKFIKDMKKIIIVISVLFTISLVTKAQSSFGVRLSASHAYGGELSYQHHFGEKLRLELDFGGATQPTLINHFYTAYGVAVIQKVFPTNEKNLFWYLGVGAKGGYYINKYDDNGIYSAVCGQIGLEYRIKALPLQFSVDIRPEFGFTEWWDDPVGFGLSIRYMIQN